MNSITPKATGCSQRPVAMSVAVRALRADRFDRLEPLWLGLHEHHVRLAPCLAGMPARSAHESWELALANYLRWARDPQTFVLVAEVDHELVGYAFVTVGGGYSSWNSGEAQGHLQTLVVAPSARGLGVGSRLLAAVREQLSRAAIETIALSAICANDRAHRFYEREGFGRTEIVFVAATDEQRTHPSLPEPHPTTKGHHHA